MKSLKQFKSKKGTLLSIWWFFVLAIVGAGIVIGALIFYGANTDVRKLEADILSDRVLNCVTNQGVVNPEFISGKLDIFSKCGLFKELIMDKGVYMIKVESIDDSGKIKEIYIFGPDIEKDCAIKESILSAYKYPYCSTKVLEFSESNGKLSKLKIITGSSYIKGNLYA